MKKTCGTVVFREYDLDRTLDAIYSAGYRYFETQATNPWCNHVVLGKDDPVLFAKKAKDHGFLGITSLWTPEGALIPAGENCVPTIKRAIEWASAAGIPVLDFGDGHKPADMPEEEAFARLSERILTLLETAEKYNVVLALEPHGTFSLTAEGLARILSISDSPYLGINYDCANIHRAGYVETRDGAANWRALSSGGAEVEVLKTVVHRVVHFHAKDLTADGVCTALGTGTVDVAGCVQVLKEAGYTGAVSLETEGGMPFAESVELAEVSSRYLDGILG
ncbi:MAG: sugar phosphate isomerase/epimerase [Clostridia bacterium]|nr:sugar phosphate isomerase/epimerase [Clostridia bacterium]